MKNSPREPEEIGEQKLVVDRLSRGFDRNDLTLILGSVDWYRKMLRILSRLKFTFLIITCGSLVCELTIPEKTSPETIVLFIYAGLASVSLSITEHGMKKSLRSAEKLQKEFGALFEAALRENIERNNRLN